MSSEIMERLKIKAETRSAVVNEIARILWENGEMLAQTEGGSMPSWQEIIAACSASFEPGDDRDDDFIDACGAWRLSHIHQAEALLSLDVAGSLTLAKHLTESALRIHQSIELDLWHKIERAKGFEPGSLTGAPGVTQRVAL